MACSDSPPNGLGCPKGIALLETLIAIIILGAALVSISYFFSQGRANIERSARQRCGITLAQDKIEELKDVPYAHADLGGGFHSDTVTADGEPLADANYVRQWNVTAVADDANGTGEVMDYKLVELWVFDQRLDPESANPYDPDRLIANMKTFISP
jgi:Tfp pilus assembly protein PilV